jgi:hypothetical protein
MPKPLKKPVRPKRPSDPNQWAHQLVKESTEEYSPEPTPAEISRVMAVLGRKGGKIGGKRRLETMTGEERSQAALKAARVRWKRVKAAKRS